MNELLSLGAAVAIALVCGGLAYLVYRARRSHGRADHVVQLLATEDAVVTVEIQVSSASRGPSVRDGRLCRRTAHDGTIARRVDVHATFRVLGIDRHGRYVASDVLAPIQLRDATTLEVLPDALAPSLRERLAPFASLDPRVIDGALSVADRFGQRVPLHDVVGPLVTSLDVSPRNDVTVLVEGGPLRLVGAPRAHLERHGRALGTLELLGARLFGAGVGSDALVLSELDLVAHEAVVTRVDGRGDARYATRLGRPIAHVHCAVMTRALCVVVIGAVGAHLLELVAIDLDSGAVRWRCAP